MTHQPVSDKTALANDNRVYPCFGTGTLTIGECVIVRYTDDAGATQTIEGCIEQGEQHGRGHQFELTVFHDAENTTSNVDADTVTVRTAAWDRVSAPVCEGERLTSDGRLGADADVFAAGQWADLQLGSDREAEFERRGEYATRPRPSGLQY